MKKSLLIAALFASASLTAQEQRVPLFEVFTSSTCGPCKPGNTIFHNVVDNRPDSQYVQIKYQQNFPTPGDPYATNESVTRRSSYYSIGGIPRMEIDGGWDQNAGYFTNTVYDNARAVPAEYRLNGEWAYDSASKKVTAVVNHTALTTAAAAMGTRLYVAIVETETHQNVKSNGETEFFWVVKKMLPDQSGTLLSGVTVNNPESTTFTFSFAGNYRLPADGQPANRINHAIEHSVENFNNLRMVAWVQGSNKQVHQAANLKKVSVLGVKEMSASLDQVTVYPNPANNVVRIAFSMKKSDNVSATILSLNGAVVAQQMKQLNAGSQEITFDTQELPAGYYNVVVLDSENNAVVEPITVLH